jgi:DNA-3-methyladenine glycosylase II
MKRKAFKEAQGFLLAADSVVARLIATLPEPAAASHGNVFNDLMSCIIEQQIHYRSTKKLFQNMLKRATLNELTPDNFAQFEEAALAQAKLSLRKLETVERIVKFWRESDINWQSLSDDEARAKLNSVQGIGPWTVDMILLFTLERPNVFPVDDFHLKQIMTTLYGLDEKAQLKKQMLNVAANWGEHRSLAVKYLLAWKAQARKRK